MAKIMGYNEQIMKKNFFFTEETTLHRYFR